MSYPELFTDMSPVSPTGVAASYQDYEARHFVQTAAVSEYEARLDPRVTTHVEKEVPRQLVRVFAELMVYGYRKREPQMTDLKTRTKTLRVDLEERRPLAYLLGLSSRLLALGEKYLPDEWLYNREVIEHQYTFSEVTYITEEWYLDPLTAVNNPTMRRATCR